MSLKFNLGRKPSETSVAEAPDENKKDIYYPTVYISTEDVEGLDLKMGEKVKLVGVVTGKNEHKRDDKKAETSFDIDVLELDKGYSDEEYLKKSDDEKDEIDEKDLKGKAEKKEEEE